MENFFTRWDLHQSITSTPCTIEGSIPSWLSGVVLRNTPVIPAWNTQLKHWFDGQSMIVQYQITPKWVTVKSSYLQTKQYQSLLNTWSITYAEFGTDPCVSLFHKWTNIYRNQRVTDNASVNIVPINNQYYALSEIPSARHIDPQTLETLSNTTPLLQLSQSSHSAHPHIDPVTWEYISYMTTFWRKNIYTFYSIDSTNHTHIIGTISRDKLSYMHSFCATEHYIIAFLQPYYLDPRSVVGKHSFAQSLKREPNHKTTVVVLSKAIWSIIYQQEVNPFFYFHTINAYELDGYIYCDIVSYDNADIVDLLRVDELENQSSTHDVFSKITRHIINLEQQSYHQEIISTVSIELPVINSNYNQQPYNIIYGTSSSVSQWVHHIAESIIKITISTWADKQFSKPWCFFGEPIFIALPDSKAEDDGVLISTWLRPDNNESFLIILDAKTMIELAYCSSPHTIPLWLHGIFISQ